jgi:hypothetical protein
MSDTSKPTRGGKRPNAGRKPSGKETVVIRVDKQLLPDIEKLKKIHSGHGTAAQKKSTNKLNQLLKENTELKKQLDTYWLKLAVLKQELEELTQKLSP